MEAVIAKMYDPETKKRDTRAFIEASVLFYDFQLQWRDMVAKEYFIFQKLKNLDSLSSEDDNLSKFFSPLFDAYYLLFFQSRDSAHAARL